MRINVALLYERTGRKIFLHLLRLKLRRRLKIANIFFKKNVTNDTHIRSGGSLILNFEKETIVLSSDDAFYIRKLIIMSRRNKDTCSHNVSYYFIRVKPGKFKANQIKNIIDGLERNGFFKN